MSKVRTLYEWTFNISLPVIVFCVICQYSLPDPTVSTFMGGVGGYVRPTPLWEVTHFVAMTFCDFTKPYPYVIWGAVLAQVFWEFRVEDQRLKELQRLAFADIFNRGL